MRRSIPVLLALSLVLAIASSALAGVSGAHFVGSPSISSSGTTATVSGRVAGLGNVEQIHVVATGEAACINKGGNHPQAANKATASASGDFPVQNGKADFSLLLTAVFSPDCHSMTIRWTLINVTVTAPGVNLQFP